MVSQKLDSHFASYATYHRHPINQNIHKFAIPLIIFHLLAMLDWVVLWRYNDAQYISLGHVFAALVVAYYFTLHAKMALVMLAFMPLLFTLAALTPKPWVIAIAIVAWVAQLLGHFVWEKNSPAFATNALQTLIGPLYFLAVVLGEWPNERSARIAAHPEPVEGSSGRSF